MGTETPRTRQKLRYEMVKPQVHPFVQVCPSDVTKGNNDTERRRHRPERRIAFLPPEQPQKLEKMDRETGIKPPS